MSGSRQTIECVYLQEGVDVSHRWDEIGDEGLQAVFQLNGLRHVADKRNT